MRKRSYIGVLQAGGTVIMVIVGLIVLFIVVNTYFMPTYVAYARRHPNLMAISTLNTLLGTFYTAGGGCVAIDAGKTLRADGQIVIPKAVSTPWAATPVRITGSTNPMASADALATPTGGSTLDLRYAGNRILALGQGTVEIDHNLIKNGGTSCGTFIYSTLAVMKIHDEARKEFPIAEDKWPSDGLKKEVQ